MSAYHTRIAESGSRPVVYEGMRTPWGTADNVKVVAPGVGWVGTPGHGGVKISPALTRRMPAYMRRPGGWYEEDVDWALPYVALADMLRGAGEGEKVLGEAMETLRQWHPAEYEQFTGEEIHEGQSHVKDERIFRDRHANDLVVISAINSSERPGMVEVTATPGGVRDFGGARRFLVPKEEYAARSGFGFVIEDPARYEEIAGERRASLPDGVDTKPPPRPRRSSGRSGRSRTNAGLRKPVAPTASAYSRISSQISDSGERYKSDEDIEAEFADFAIESIDVNPKGHAGQDWLSGYAVMRFPNAGENVAGGMEGPAEVTDRFIVYDADDVAGSEIGWDNWYPPEVHRKLNEAVRVKLSRAPGRQGQVSAARRSPRLAGSAGTLADWAADSGIRPTTPTTERAAVSVTIDQADPRRAGLWHLSDYAVSTSTGAVVWLVPRMKTNER